MPWVSRQYHDTMVGRLETQLESSNLARQEVSALYRKLQDDYDKLVNRLMDRQIPEIPSFEQVGPDLDSDILTAITQRADPGTPTYNQIYTTAVTMSRAGANSSTIVDAILQGDNAPV